MKKLLIATTAIVAAGTAQAAEWETGVSGYMQLGFGVAENRGTMVLQDGEVHFDANLAADNGISFRAHVELEAVSAADNIDETYGVISGSFGSVKIGGDDSALNAYGGGVIYAPGARVAYYDGFGLTNNNAQQGVADITNDSQGIHYDTPNFNGFQAGFSYIPNPGAAGEDASVFTDEAGAGYAAGASYSGDFDGFGVAIGAGWGDTNAANVGGSWHVGSTISVAGFRLAGNYEEDNSRAGSNREEMSIGAGYSNGPISVGAGYSVQTRGANTEVGAAWLTYAVAPGVSATVGGEYHDDSVTKELAGVAYMVLSF